jgi:hypothetical protein
MTAEADGPLRLGISACLLGEAVRFDGGHKRDSFLVNARAFCRMGAGVPRAESGLGVPRESMRLVQMHREIRLVTGKTAQDRTDTVKRYTVRKLEEIAEQGLCGFVLKKDRPPVAWSGSACSTPVACRPGTGASSLPRRWPSAFPRCRSVAGGKSLPRADLQTRYSTEFRKTLRTVATPRRHGNVLRHMPLIVPLTLFAHHLRRHNVSYLAGQVYLRPHPAELMLRNDV